MDEVVKFKKVMYSCDLADMLIVHLIFNLQRTQSPASPSLCCNLWQMSASMLLRLEACQKYIVVMRLQLPHHKLTEHWFLQFAYGACEMLFNPFKDWPTRGPFAPTLLHYLCTSRIRWYQKLSMLCYISSYLVSSCLLVRLLFVLAFDHGFQPAGNLHTRAHCVAYATPAITYHTITLTAAASKHQHCSTGLNLSGEISQGFMMLARQTGMQRRYLATAVDLIQRLVCAGHGRCGLLLSV